MEICLIKSSEIGPGPLGILATSPIAEAPNSIAVFASSMLLMQHILIRGFIFIKYLVDRMFTANGSGFVQFVLSVSLIPQSVYRINTRCFVRMNGYRKKYNNSSYSK